MNPIFIIGTERSGTNLMRLILNAHSSIAIPHPPHILKNFFRLEPLYFDLKKDTNFKRLVKDVVKMVRLHPYPWDVTIDENKIFNDVKQRNLLNVFFALYDQHLDCEKKKRWGCKSTFMIAHVASILKYYRDAQFIYMVRDGRDVACSAKRSIFNHYHVYYTAHLWKKEQQIGLYWLNQLSLKNIILIRYEDLLENPAESISTLCDFLNEPCQDEMLKFYKSDEARKGGRISESWKNTAGPIINDNIGKYKKEFSEKKIDLFEAIAAPELDCFGYELTKPLHESEERRNRGIKNRFNYLLEELLFMGWVQLQSLFKDKNNGKRYKKYWFLKLLPMMRRIQWS